MVKIKGVSKNSIAERCGIKNGDTLISVNGNEINDLLDYKFYIYENAVTLMIDRKGSLFSVNIKKPEYDDIGLEFETYMMDDKKSCSNKCIFCFIDQLPDNPKLRDTLYFKDDDERLSFLHGNYITLTNLHEWHIDRIIKMRISPINISVHTTNPELRCKMMNNKRAGETLDYIKKLSDNNIALNTQIVLCKDINDKQELERTLRDLCGFYPSMRSIAVVPSGLTKYRSDNELFPLISLSKTDCAEIIKMCGIIGDENIKKYGERLIYCSDEIFLKAKIAIPSGVYYDDYPQIENGVGMIRDFIDEYYSAIDDFFGEHGKSILLPSMQKRKISVATGVAAYPVIKTLCDDIMTKCGGMGGIIECKVYCIGNDFFGREITVAGLITGKDLINRLLPDRDSLGSELLIPSVMLRHERDLFLDSVSVDEVSQNLNVKLTVVDNTAEDFIMAVTGIQQD